MEPFVQEVRIVVWDLSKRIGSQVDKEERAMELL